MDLSKIAAGVDQCFKAFCDDLKANDARKCAEGIAVLVISAFGGDLDKVTGLSSMIEKIKQLKKASKVPGALARKLVPELEKIRWVGNEDSHFDSSRESALDDQDLAEAKDSLVRALKIIWSEDYFIDCEIPPYIYSSVFPGRVPSESWRGNKIIKILYPNREFSVVKAGKGYELYIVNEMGGVKIGFLVVGRNVTFAPIFADVAAQEQKMASLTILIPKEISATTGHPVYKRLEYVKRLAMQGGGLCEKILIDFIQDFVWKNCLPAEFKGSAPPELDPHFVDHALICESDGGNEVESLNLVASIAQEKARGDKPIYFIIGAGGTGKTTFCEQAVNYVNSKCKDNRRAFLISSYDVDADGFASDYCLDSISGLYHILGGDKAVEDAISLNISSGNIIIFIDGLDEIKSKLKDKFIIEKFFSSIVELNHTYGNCSVIVTSREMPELEEAIDGLTKYSIRGFDAQRVEKYLSSRFVGEPARVKESQRIIERMFSYGGLVPPLLLRLVADYVKDGADEADYLGEASSKYFDLSQSFDSVFYNVIRREIEKQQMQIECDQYFEVIRDVVFDGGGSAEYHVFDDYVGMISERKELLRAFRISNLLGFDDAKKVVRPKYEAVSFWVKSRYIFFVLSTGGSVLSDGALARVVSQECYGGGALVDAVCSLRGKDRKVEREEAMKLVSLPLEMNKRKLFSALLYMYFSGRSGARDSNSELLLDFYGAADGDVLNGLSIFGDFYPLDFGRFKVKDGFFYNYANFSKCSIPKEATFINCELLGEFGGGFPKGGIYRSSFIDCKLESGILEALALEEQSEAVSADEVRSDLKKILRIGFFSGSFAWKSEGIYLQQCHSLKARRSLSWYLQFLCDQNVLSREQSKSASVIGYVVKPESRVMVKDFLTQGVESQIFRALIAAIVGSSR